LRRHAAAGLDRPRLLVLAGSALDGRALRRPRRDDARTAEHGAAAHLGRDGLDGRVRHALDLRGGVPLDARRRDVGAARSDHDDRSDRSAATADGRDARGAALLRARDRSTREPACRRRRPCRRGSDRRGSRRMSSAAPAVPYSTTAWQRAGRRLRTWLPAVVVFGLGILAWQWFLPDVVHVKRFLLPRFSAVMTTFWDERHTLWSAGWFTFQEALAGFALGCSVAFALALVLAPWRPLGNALMPHAIAANAIPIIAFAPITNAWFGLLSPWSKIVIAAVPCFFPVLVNSLRGLTSVPAESLELMRSYAAGQPAIFRRVRIPTCL